MPKAFDRCVRKVRGKRRVKNPYAVCRSSMGTDAQIRARHGGRSKPKRRKR